MTYNVIQNYINKKTRRQAIPSRTETVFIFSCQNENTKTLICQTKQRLFFGLLVYGPKEKPRRLPRVAVATAHAAGEGAGYDKQADVMHGAAVPIGTS